MPAKTLLSAIVTITNDASEVTQAVLDNLPEGSNPDVDPESVLHRSVTCTAFDKTNDKCAYKAKLNDMLTTSAKWSLDGLDNYTPTDHIFWRYKIDSTDTWKEWNDNDDIKVDSESATISVEAWSPCGKLASKDFTIFVHLHTPRDICPSLRKMWSDLSSEPRTDPDDDSVMCAYKDSDFVALKYLFDSETYTTHDLNTVAGYYSSLTCYVAIAKSGETSSATESVLSPNLGLAGDELTSADAEAAFELVYDPSTSIDTDIKVRCEFTYTHFGGATSEVQTCDPVVITATDCDEPTLSNVDVCGEGVCEDPNGLPGLYESCSGIVYTTVGSETSLKEVSGECCHDCAGLACKSLGLDSMPELGRCEVETAPFEVAALLTLDSDSLNNASVSSFTPLILCASALVALVALVVVKRRAGAAEPKDDIYYPLLD